MQEVGQLTSSAVKLASDAINVHQAVAATARGAASMPIDPVTSTVAASINVAFKLADFVLKINAASDEIDVFARLIQRVRRDREEVLRERHEKNKILLQSPSKLKWVNAAITDMDAALVIIGQIVETARVDGMKGKGVTLVHRFEWVLAHKEEFVTKQTYLATCHASLMGALSYMQNLPALRYSVSSEHLAPPPPSYTDASPDPESEMDTVLRPPFSRQPKPPQEKYLLPTTPPDGLDLKFDDLRQQQFGPSSSSSIGTLLSRHDSAAPSPWDQAGKDEVMQEAAQAMRNVGRGSAMINNIAEELPRSPSVSTIDARRRRREAYFREAEPKEGTEETTITATQRPPISRASTATRRRHIAAHFGQTP